MADERCSVRAGLLPVAAMLLLAAASAGAEPAPPSSWSVGLRTTAYAFQTEDAAGDDTDHLRLYQHFAGSAARLAGGRLTFRLAGRFANDPADDPLRPQPLFERSRLHVGLLEARLGARTRVQAGRQFLQAGVASLTLDGVRAAYRGRGGLELEAWGGAAVPFAHAFDLADLDTDAAAGARAVLRPGRGHRLGVSAAYRERRGVTAARPVGAEYVLTAVRGLRALARGAYDLETERWTRLEAQGQWRPVGGRTVVTAQYVDRHPSIDAASWFARFTDLERIRLGRASVRWESPARWGGELEWLGSFRGARADTRVGVAALLPIARVGWTLRAGDAGDEDTIYGEIAWQARPWLRLEGEASRLTYALFEDAPADQERELTTLAGRARLRLRSGLNVTAEVQRLENPRYDGDVRLLVGMDLAMGRGASRFGLDRGGWLR